MVPEALPRLLKKQLLPEKRQLFFGRSAVPKSCLHQ